MNPRYSMIWSVATIAAVLAGNAQAQTSSSAASALTPASNVSTAEAKPEETGAGFKLPFNLNYNATFFGPELARPTEYWAPSARMSDQNDPATQDFVFVRHTATIGRDLGKGLNLSANAYFNTVVTDPANTGNTKGFFWNDSYLKLAKPDVAEADIGGSKLGLGGDVRYYAPTSRVSQLNENRGQLRLSVNPNLRLGDSIFSITSVNYAKYWFNSREYAANSNGTAPMTLLELYTGPQVNAQVTDWLNVFVLYEAILHRDTFGDWDNSADSARYSGVALTDIEPGMDIQIGKHITVSPFLNWYPTLPLETMTWNLSLNAAL